MTTTDAEKDLAPLPGATIGQALGRFAAGAFRLRGRASRSEYWWWMLVNVLVLGATQFALPWLISRSTPNPSLLLGPFGSLFYAHIPLFAVDETAAPESPLAAFFLIVAGVWMVVTLIPAVTVAVRRLHDGNLSGFWAVLAVFPFGAFVVLLLALRRSRTEGARFD